MDTGQWLSAMRGKQTTRIVAGTDGVDGGKTSKH